MTAQGAGRRRRGPQDEEHTTPPYGYSLANERTFLAWVRTALATLAGAVVLHEFAARIQPRWFVMALSVAVACLSAALGAAAYWRWKRNEHAIRQGRPLPRSPLFLVVSVGILALASATAVLLVLQ